MSGFIRVIALIGLVNLTACSEGGSEPSLMSEAIASPATSVDYGWRTNAAPGAQEEGSVAEYY